MEAVALVLAGFGVLFLLLAFSRWLAGRRWASSGHVVLASTALVSAAVMQPVAANLATYQVRHPAGPVAQVFCERTASRTHRLTLTRLPGGHMQVFEVGGDEWRIDARTLDWRGPAAELGLRPVFRLDTLSTRTVRAEAPASTLPSSYALSEERGDDVWAQARTGTIWSRYVVADHADGPWLPLTHGARYEVALEAKGLQARPVNQAAAKSLRSRP